MIIFLITAAAFAAFRPVTQTANLSWARTAIVAVPLGLLSGWIAAASLINVDQALLLSNIELFGWSPAQQSLATIVASGGLCATLLVFLRGSMIFAAAPVWALTAIVVAAVYRTPNPAIGTTAAIFAFGLVALTIWLNYRLIKQRPRLPGPAII